MIKEFYFENLGPISVIDGSLLGKINLIVGENSVGKTFILKTLYSLTKSREEYGRGASKKI